MRLSYLTFLFATVFSSISAAQQGPVLVSATPSTGGGSNQTFTFVYASPAGAGALSNVGVLINSQVDGRNSCWVNYEAAAGRVWLAGDNLSWSYGPIGSRQILQNSQCSIDLSGTSAWADSTNLTFNVAIRFSASFTGNKNFYMRASDTSGTATDYTPMGNWTVGSYPAGQVSSSVAAMAVNPASGFGLDQTFQFNYTDPATASNLSMLSVRIPTASTARTCWVVYDTTWKYLSLASDDTSSWSFATIGSQKTLQNSQCSVDASRSSVVASGQTISLYLKLAFSSTFTGYKTLYMRAQNKAGSTSDFTQAGTWNTFSPTVMQTLTKPATSQIGTHWANTSELPMMSQNLNYKFAIVTVDPSNSSQILQTLNTAQQNGMKLIIGAYPIPYSMQADGTWNISSAGVNFLSVLAAHPAAVQAVFVFNEPYWVNPYTGANDTCGIFSADQLRKLRTKIQSVWSGAKIYHDIGDPQSWLQGGISWRSCVGQKYADQTGIADYVGIWNYPFTATSYDRQAGLDFAYNSSRYVLSSMQPAQPVFLGQTFEDNVNLKVPNAGNLKDWNCAVRSVLPTNTMLSWYVWRQPTQYSNYLSLHPDLWPSTTPGACSN